MKILSQRMLNFCKLIAPNYGEWGAGTRAARDAGYPKTTARQVANKLLKKPEIIAQIEEEQKKLAEEVDKRMSTQEIIDRYVDMARKKGDYSNATVTEAERALKQLGKYKNMQGFAEKVIIEEREPFDDWSLEELLEYKATGKVPKGKKFPDIKSARGFISRILSEESGTSVH